MLDNLYFTLLALAPPESAFLAVTGVSVDVWATVKRISNVGCVFLVVAAAIYGSWCLYEAFSDDSVSTKKKAILVLLGGVLMCALIVAVRELIFSPPTATPSPDFPPIEIL